MRLRTFAVLILAWSVQSHAIVNGQSVLGSPFQNAHQYLVNLLFVKPDGNNAECLGTLIHEKFVLTAKHCLKGNTLVGIHFFYYQGGKLKTRQVKKEGVHWYLPEDSPKKDIGIVMIDAAPSFAQPVTFMPESWDPTTAPNVYTVATAFTHDFKKGLSATQLSYVEQQKPAFYQHVEYLATLIPKWPLETRFQRGVCGGDSGAPTLVVENGEVFYAGHLTGGTGGSTFHAFDFLGRSYTLGEVKCDLRAKFVADTKEIEMLNEWMQYMAADPSIQVQVKGAN